MIRSSRVAHRGIVTLLALAIPMGIAAGLAARQPIPVLHPTDPALHGLRVGALPAGATDVERVPLAGLDLSVARVELNGRSYLDLYPGPGLLEPDVLVYHSTRDALSVAELPEDALLLGTLAGLEPRRFQLPAERRGGTLLLYSLAHARSLGRAVLPD